MFTTIRKRYFIKAVCFILSLLVIFDLCFIFSPNHQQSEGKHLERNSVITTDIFIQKAECLQNKRFSIVNEMYGIIEEMSENQLNPFCHENRQIVFIKTHYCGEEVVENILKRYALRVNLSVVLPVRDSETLGWPHQIETDMFRPLKTPYFDILMDSTVYNRQRLKSTVFLSSPKRQLTPLTIVQNPVKRIATIFDMYYKCSKAFQRQFSLVSSPGGREKALSAFFDKLEYYNSVYSSIENMEMTKECPCLYGVSLLRNSMAFDLGFPTGYHMTPPSMLNNYTFTRHWLQQIQEEFPVVLLQEHLESGLVLLKRYLCLEMKDILFIHTNSPPETISVVENQQKEKLQEFKQWSHVDNLLYTLFNKSFWLKVNAQGQDFKEEVNAYQFQRKQTHEFCKPYIKDRNFDLAMKTSKDYVLGIKATKWNPEYSINPKDCVRMFTWFNTNLREELKDVYQSWQPKANEGLHEYKRYRYIWC